MTRTQIGGKYDIRDTSLFTLKQQLQAANIVVSHPLADKIVSAQNGQSYAFDPKHMNFYDVETDYYHCIATSDFHTVNNTFLAEKGYLGSSAALEICIAMVHSKPIVLLYEPVYKHGLDVTLVKIIAHNLPKIYVNFLPALDSAKLQAFVRALPKTQTYHITASQRRYCLAAVDKLFATIRQG
jgi:hypothetical protein